MTSVTISPPVKVAALVGVLLIALGGSAFFVMHGQKHESIPITTPPTQQPTTTHHGRVHVVKPTVDPLLPTPVRDALKRNAIVVVGFYNPHSAVSGRTIMEARAGAE